MVGSFGTDETARLMDRDPPAGKYIEKTPDGETYAIFEYDGKSHWKVQAAYAGKKPRFRYHVSDGHLSSDVGLWYFSGLKMENPADNE